jgi:hypothetical protein
LPSPLLCPLFSLKNGKIGFPRKKKIKNS